MKKTSKGSSGIHDTPLPHDAGAEQDVVGCLLIDPKLISEVRDILTVADFWTEPARIVFQAITDAVETVPDYPDVKAVVLEIERVGALERIGGVAFLQSCMERIADATNVPAYARHVKSCANRRLVIDSASYAIHAASTGNDYDGSIRELISVMKAAEPSRRVEADPVLVCMADVESTPVDWLWPNRIALGRITLLVGKPGEGKSYLTIDMASRITRGVPWPDGTWCPSGSVIFITAEDDPGDTIRPRLDAHGADVKKVHLISAVRKHDARGTPREMMFSLDNLPELETALQRVPDCRLVVIDPIGSFLGGKVDAHRDNEVRSVLAPIAKLAEKTGVAFLIVAHRRKGSAESADDTALGSRAFTGIARATWHLSRDKDDKHRRLLLPGKNNLAPEGSGLAFSFFGEPAVLNWESEPVHLTADEALAMGSSLNKSGPEAIEKNAACLCLKEKLADGPRPAKTLIEELKEGEGISKRTLDRARQVVGVKAYRPVNPGPWYWCLPGQAQLSNESNEAESGQLGNVAMCENSGGKRYPARNALAHRQDDIFETKDAVQANADPTGWGREPEFARW